MAESINGFKFLCDILSTITVPSDLKAEYRAHCISGDPLPKNQVNLLCRDFADFAGGLWTQRQAQIQSLSSLLCQHFGADADARDFFTEAYRQAGTTSWQKAPDSKLYNVFESLFYKRKSIRNSMLSGIVLAITVGVGYQQNPKFHIGSTDALSILSRTFDMLGWPSADFLPDSEFDLNQSQLPESTQKLLALSLFSVLKYLFPHKAGQEQANLDHGTAAINQLVEDHASDKIFCAIRTSREAQAICNGIVQAMQDELSTVAFPNGTVLNLSDFYNIPNFELLDRSSSAEILRCDDNHMIRTMVLGSSGSGKSLLCSAIALTCLESSHRRNSRLSSYAAQLGLDSHCYLPLLIRCRDIHNLQEITKGDDLLELALDQMVHRTRNSCYASCLSHLEDYRSAVLTYLRQRARHSSLLLMVEDFSILASQLAEVFYERLRDLSQNKNPYMHVVITAQRMSNAWMHRFCVYNRVEIASLPGNMEDQIRLLANCGIGDGDLVQYQQRMHEDRFLSEFVSTPAHLVRFLCHSCDDEFDMDLILQQTIDEQMNMHSNGEHREFLTALAVLVTENKILRHHAINANRQSIPKNITHKADLQQQFGKIVDNPDAVWQYIQDQRLLITLSSGINSYMFSNRLFYCSLAADHYLTLLESDAPENWLDRLNHIVSADFSTIIVLLLKRLCRYEDRSASLPSAFSRYNIQLMVQAVTAYVMMQEQLRDLYECLCALDDILFCEQLFCAFTDDRRDSHRLWLWRLLQRVYVNGYHRYRELTDDPDRLLRLHEPIF